MSKFFFKFYDSLGTTKAQKFWRMFLITALICSTICYGFKSDAIKLSLTKTFTSEQK